VLDNLLLLSVNSYLSGVIRDANINFVSIFNKIKSELFFDFLVKIYVMTEHQRIRKVIDWLVYIGYARNEKEIAGKLGYTKSSFSQIINGKVPLSGRFVEKLSAVDENINKVWILTGEGRMLKKNYPEDTLPSAAAEAALHYGKGRMDAGCLPGSYLSGEVEMKTLLDILKEKDRQIEVMQMQINDLINLLKS
jgi:transcriptional regulator with XRE-family HTH domain